MNSLLLIFSLVLQVHSGERINDALDSARAVYAARGERTTVLIEPGTYQEELTIDVPGLTLRNAAKKPSIGLQNNGVDCDPLAVRITWYYGHGYQYRSMGETPNYGGSRTRRWNASVLISAPDFTAENIIFENSFNLYVSEREAADSLVDISQSDLPWTEKERPKRMMPARPKEVGSVDVQKKQFRERAAAISFTETAKNAHLKNCRAVGRQDVVYGDQGASVWWQGGVLQGGVDFIFGGMCFCADRTIIVANINGEKNDYCYISAGRSGGDPTPPPSTLNPQLSTLNTQPSTLNPQHGLLFYRCHIRLATEDELKIVNRQSSNRQMVWLARPWRWWGETVWAYTTWDEDVLNAEAWNVGLVKDKEGYNPDCPCPNSYEYRSQDGSVGRPSWVKILNRPILPDGTKLTPKTWFSTPK